jgi:hypothetical protein
MLSLVDDHRPRSCPQARRKVINEISGRVHRALHSGRADGMTLHNTLPAAVTEMLEKVCAIYAEEVADASASEPPVSDELETRSRRA